MTKQLSVRLDDRRVGVLAQSEHGRLSFTYLPEWIEYAEGMPISMALPLAAKPYGDHAVRTFFEGYLPDEGQDLQRIAKHFGVSARSTFRLLKGLGGDLAGALSIHETAAPLTSDADRAPSFEVLDEPGLADLLRSLERSPLGAGPGGLRLSLAGAQSKTALYMTEDGAIAKTTRDYPSSHIIKPALRTDVPDLALLEYFSLELARAVGLQVPPVTYGTAQGVPYVLIERYDRTRDAGGRIERLHQEDFCQALGVPPQQKYQSEGGPGLPACFELLTRLRAPAVARLRLLDLVIFNWLVGNHDAHGKNFSILYTPDGPELAPVYDVVSVLVYEQDGAGVWNRNMAMRIGKVRLGTDVTPAEWTRFGKATGFAWPAIRRRIDTLSRAVPAQAIALEHRLASERHTTPHFHRAIDLLLEHAARLRVGQKLGLVPPGELPERVAQAGVGDDPDPASGTAVGRRADERLDFETRYRRRMTERWTAHDRARRAGQHEEDLTYETLGKDLTRAFRRWESGDALSGADASLLRTHVGRLPGEPRTSAERSPSLPPKRSLALRRGEDDARAASRRAADAAMEGAGLHGPRAVVLTAVPSMPLDLADLIVQKDGPLQELLRQPPRWRVGGFDLLAGHEVQRKQGTILRVAVPGAITLDVWIDGTIAAAFAPGVDRVTGLSHTALRLNGLELAERLVLFADLAERIFDLAETPVEAAQLALRMHQLRDGEERLVLGPYVPGTYGWQFQDDLRHADIDDVNAESVVPRPINPERAAYPLLRDVYLAFGVPMDDLPFLADEAGTRSISKEAFLDFVGRLRR